MLFHVSGTPDIKIIIPKISTHKKAYVYALENLSTALLFGAKKDDFDFIIDEENGKAVVHECYKNAFWEIYYDKKCYLYEVEDIDFKKGITGWESEFISEKPVRVIKETKIDNLFDYLMDEVQKGNIILNKYNNSSDYKSLISNHILDRLIRFEMLDGEVPDKLSRKFPRLIKALRRIISGEYLD